MQRRHALIAALGALPIAVRAQRAELQFVRAEYGAGRRQMDVSAAVAQWVQRGQSAQVGNALFGSDPAPGQRKRLRVIGRDRRGREREVDFEEDAWFDAGLFTTAGSTGGGGWRIQHARWGVGRANVDVTQHLRELARSGQRFLIANDTFGADPAPGVVKSLRVVAVDDAGRRQRFEFPEGSWLDGQPFAGWGGGDWGGSEGDWDDAGMASGPSTGPTRPGARLFIEYAEYTADDGRRMDLTQRLQELAERQGRLDLRVDNRSLGGDPAPGAPKRLWLRWRGANGRVRERSWREGERLVLP